MQLKTLIVAVFLPILLICVLGIVFLKQKKDLELLEQQRAKQEQEERQKAEERAEIKHKKQQEEERKRRPKELVQKGIGAEDREKWASAARYYRESLQYADIESTKQKLQAVTLVMEAEKLEKKGEWDNALAAYEKAREHITNKKYVDGRLTHIKGRNKYQKTYAEAEAYEKAEKTEDAIGAFEEALKLAKTYRLKTDALAKIAAIKKKTVKKKEEKADVFELIRALAARKDLFALLATYNCYIRDPEFAPVKGKLEKERETTIHLLKEGIAKEARETKGAKETKRDNRRIVQVRLKKDGSTITGTLTGETEKVLTIRVSNKYGETRNRLILREDVASIGEVAEKTVSIDEAERLFAEAVAAYARNSYFETLTALGKLQFQYPDAPIIHDAERQKTMIARQSIPLLKETGGTLQGLATKAADFCQDMCFECNGTGWVECKQCGGRGLKRLICNACAGKGTKPCEFCGMKGRLGAKKCPICKGTKEAPCEFCKGKGYIEVVCDACAKHPCPLCRGRKRKPIGPCPDCKGTGRVATGGGMDCPKCGGTGIAVSDEPCPRCGGSGVKGETRCPACKGTGKRRH
ncbi:MAG: hypothetical protein GXP25_02610 [Planctomycetes bacterium]|nr:hypothetical protein [Planctomycetota bacterium]